MTMISMFVTSIFYALIGIVIARSASSRMRFFDKTTGKTVENEKLETFIMTFIAILWPFLVTIGLISKAIGGEKKSK